MHDIKRTWFGDADLNGEFTIDDIVQVSIAGTYMDLIDNNSTWATGDWNVDGEFTEQDFVVAFIDGGFNRGRRVDFATVPEPTSLLLVTMAVTMITVGRLVARERPNKTRH